MKKTKIYSLMVLTFGLAVTACSNLDESKAIIPPPDNTIFSETFATSLGNFTSFSVLGDQIWTYDSRMYAGMSGFIIATKTSVPNEDWLISPEIDLSQVTASNVSFDYVAHLMGNVSVECTVWVSENYQSGSNPTTAEWTQLPTNLIQDPGNYVFTNSGQLSLNAYSGKKIKIAIKYLSSATKAGTLEIKNFLVSNGNAANVIWNDGSEISPYSVAEAKLHQTSLNACVKGYIVGYVWSGNQTTYILGADTCTQATNILIADTNSLSNLYIGKCMPVQLPTGVIRTGLNLQTNKSNLGRKVVLFGSLASYFSSPGLKTVTYYKFMDNGTTAGPKPVYPIYSQTFISSQGDFTVDNKVLPIGFTSIWIPTSYGMTASGFKSVNYASESWLISPSINLTGSTSIGMTFDHTINKGVVANMKTEQTLWISTDGGTTWTQLTIPTYPAGNTWTYVNSGEINLDAYAGKKVKIAFKYISTTASSATWEVKNFLIYY
jgi:hypothetical protein